MHLMDAFLTEVANAAVRERHSAAARRQGLAQAIHRARGRRTRTRFGLQRVTSFLLTL